MLLLHLKLSYPLDQARVAVMIASVDVVAAYNTEVLCMQLHQSTDEFMAVPQGFCELVRRILVFTGHDILSKVKKGV